MASTLSAFAVFSRGVVFASSDDTAAIAATAVVSDDFPVLDPCSCIALW